MKPLRVIRIWSLQHCDLITAVSNQILIILNMKKNCIQFVSTCRRTSNCIVKSITDMSIRNPMPCSGNNYRELLDGQGT